MRYININECLMQIDEARIDRKNHANVYLCSTDEEVLLQFAYSEEKTEHFILKRTETPGNRRNYEDIWREYLVVSMLIEQIYNVKRFVDDVRQRRYIELQKVVTGLQIFSNESKDSFYAKAEEYLAENNLECLKIDRDRFAYSGKEHIVKIFLQSFNKKTVSREELARAKKLDKVVITNDRCTRPKSGTAIPTRENGYIEFYVGEEVV